MALDPLGGALRKPGVESSEPGARGRSPSPQPDGSRTGAAGKPSFPVAVCLRLR
jgi:hypothetical protein